MTQELKPGASSATTSPEASLRDSSPPAEMTARRRTTADVMEAADKAEIAWLEGLNAELKANQTPWAQRVNADAAAWRKRSGTPG